jgi:hypothetical protein
MEFIRRFLQHVLPSGLRKVRYLGLHHSSKRPTLRLIQAAMALQANRPMPDARSAAGARALPLGMSEVPGPDGVRAARAGRQVRLRTGHPAGTVAAMIRLLHQKRPA